MPVGRRHRDADAYRHVRLAPVQIERLRHHGDDPLAQAFYVRQTVHVGLQHGEFVAALTGHAVAPAQAGPQALGASCEEQVARTVAHAIVDFLEPVEIQAEHGSTAGAMSSTARSRAAARSSEHGWAGQ